MLSQEDHYSPWRKQGFLCKPWNSDRGDGLRFATEYLDAAGGIDADDAWSHAHVLEGRDGGGDAAGAPALNAAATAVAHAGGTQLDRDKRLRKVSAKLLDHIIPETSKAAMRAANPNNRLDGRAQFHYFLDNLTAPMERSDILQVKADITNSSILGCVGFGDGSVVKYKEWLDLANAKIVPDGSRLPEHPDLCEQMLGALVKTGISYISGEALTELNEAAAHWRFHNGVGGGGRRRSMDGIVAHFGGLWDSQCKVPGMIPRRAKGGSGSTVGSSTRVDGHAAEIFDSMDVAPADSRNSISLDRVPSMAELRDAFIAASSTRPNLVETKSHRWICFNCFGVDHTKNGGKMPDGTTCPPCSAPRTKRDLNSFVLLITAYAARNAGRSGITPVSTSGGKAAPSWWRQRPSGQRRGATNSRKPQAYVLEDGSIVNDDGKSVGSVSAPVAKALQIEMKDNEPASDESEGEQADDEMVDAGRGMGDPFSDSLDISADVGNEQASHNAKISISLTLVSLVLFMACLVIYSSIVVPEVPAVLTAVPSSPIGVMYAIGAVLLTPIVLGGLAGAIACVPGLARKLWKLCCAVLSLWASPMLYIFHAQPVASFTVTAASFAPYRISKPSAHGAASWTTPGRMAEEAMWRCRGYEVHDALDKQFEGMNMIDGMMTFDSGAMRHCSGDIRDATHDIEHMPKVKVRVGNGSVHQVATRSKSMQVVKTRQSMYLEKMELSQFLTCPALRSRGKPIRLFASVYAFYSDGIKHELNGVNVMTLPNGRKVRIHVNPDECKPRIMAKPYSKGVHARVASVSLTDELMDDAPLNHRRLLAYALATDELVDDDDLNHARLVHFSANRTGNWRHDPTTCRACMLGGHRHRSYNKRAPRGRANEYSYFGERISSDVCGPFPPSITHGFRYMIVYYDWYSGRVGIGYLKTKEAQAIASSLRQFVTDHKDLLKDGRVTEWHTDGDGGFTSKSIDEVCLELETRRSFSIAGESNTNPGAERIIGVMVRPMRIIAAQADGDAEPYWPFIANQVKQVHNDLPSRRFSPPASPNSKVTGKSTDIATLYKKYRVMFTRVYVRLPDVRAKSKLSATAFEAISLGWDEAREGEFVLVPELARITTARSKRHDERQYVRLPQLKNVAISHASESLLPASPNLYQQQAPRAVREQMPRVQLTMSRGGASDPVTQEQEQEQAQASSLSALAAYFMGTSSLTKWLYRSTPNAPWDVSNATTEGGPIPIPRDPHEALNGPWAKQWEAAMRSDLAKKMGNGAWELVDASIPAAHGSRVHTGKWAFAVKYENGAVKEFRARWVLRGFTMVYGQDYDDTFIGGVNCTTSRCLFAKAALKKLILYDADVKAAFTTAKIDRPIYVQCPTGFETKGKVCELKMSLEGGKSSGNLYYKEHGAVMKDKIQCEQCTADPNLYRKEWEDGEWIDIGVFVDNTLMLPSGDTALERFLSEYRKHYTITGGEPVKQFCGSEVTRDPITGAYTLSQVTKIEHYFAKYLGPNAKLRSAPVDTSSDGVKKFMSIQGAKNQTEKDAAAGKDYMGLLGCLMYVATQTRPDCCYHTSHLGQCMSNHDLKAWYALLDLLSYMYKTRSKGITFGGDIKTPETQSDPPLNVQQFLKDGGLHAWSDASHLPSHAGHVVMYANGPVAYSSRKIKVSTQSTTESEICAGVAATKDIKFVRQVLSFLKMAPSGPIPLFIDNEGMWFNVRNTGVSARTRHYESWQHFVRDAFERLILSVHLVDTNSMVADILTKALPKLESNYFKFKNIIMNIFE